MILSSAIALLALSFHVDADVCDDPRTPFDAAVTATDGSTYFFQGDKCWKWNGTMGAKPEGGSVKEFWDKQPGPVDAAFTLEAKTYLFKANQVWTYIKNGNTMKREEGPKDVSDKWDDSDPKLGPKVDAALAEKESVYFFKGTNKFFKWRSAPLPLLSDLPFAQKLNG